MTEADVIQPSASIASTGLGIRYIGDYAYAYSGTIEVTGTTVEIPMLEFTSGSGLIQAELRFMSVEAGGNDLNFFLYLNSELVGTNSINSAKDFYHEAIKIIVPPFTLVEAKGLNIDTSTGRDSTAIFTGRVYGAT